MGGFKFYNFHLFAIQIDIFQLLFFPDEINFQLRLFLPNQISEKGNNFSGAFYQYGDLIFPS